MHSTDIQDLFIIDHFSPTTSIRVSLENELMTDPESVDAANEVFNANNYIIA